MSCTLHLSPLGAHHSKFFFDKGDVAALLCPNLVEFPIVPLHGFGRCPMPARMCTHCSPSVLQIFHGDQHNRGVLCLRHSAVRLTAVL